MTALDRDMIERVKTYKRRRRSSASTYQDRPTLAFIVHSFNRIADSTGDLVSVAGLEPTVEIDGDTVKLPGDADYEKARTVFPGDVDRRPGLIVQVAGDADIARTLHHAREHDLPLAADLQNPSFANSYS